MIFFYVSLFTLEHVKRHVQSLQKDSESDQYVFQNLMWPGVYLRSNFPNTILQKVLTLVPLTATVPEVYVATMTTVLSDSYDYLVDTLNHMKSIKLKDNPGGNDEDCCDEILVDVERLESAGAFNPKYLRYIILIFEDTSNSIFHL